jgi:CheY-like chemotaxis protein
MMVQECLGDFGYQVIGPISTATEAAARANDGNFEAAVLDINLGDGAVYPIADTLAARGVPFVFVTGYDAESVDARFRNVPVLQKPIERDVLQRIFVVAAKAAVAG